MRSANADAARNALSAARLAARGPSGGIGASIGAGHAGTAGAGGTTGAPAVTRRAGRTWLTTTGSVPTAWSNVSAIHAPRPASRRPWLTTTGPCCGRAARASLSFSTRSLPSSARSLASRRAAAAGSFRSASFSDRSRSASARSCLSAGARRHAAQAARETDVNSSPPGEMKLYVVPSARRRRVACHPASRLSSWDASTPGRPRRWSRSSSRAATSETRDTFNGGAAAVGAGASSAAPSSVGAATPRTAAAALAIDRNLAPPGAV